jgi:Protein of unknown function (DUF3179)
MTRVVAAGGGTVSLLRGAVLRWFAILLVIVIGALAGSVERRVPPTGQGASIVTPGAVLSGTDHAPPGSLPGSDPTHVACSPSRVAQAVLFGVGPICAPWDSIPAIDHPRFLSATNVRFIRPDEPVVALDWLGADRAYPIQVLSYHEIVNDEVAGRPIAITFCPLCNSAVAFSRRVDGRTLTFAVTGQLNYGNLVMFDRETVSQWRQLEGVAISGRYKGTRLVQIPVQMVAFGEWRAAHPHGLVMRLPVGSPFHYGVDPYHGYGLDPTQQSVVVRGQITDPRLPPKWRVLGVATSHGSVAFPMPTGGSAAVVETARLEGLRLAAFFRYGVAQPELNYELSTSPKGWSGSVWIARLDGLDLRLVERRGRFVDATTRSVFDLFGRGISGPLAGRQLRAAPQVTSFWFAWAAFHPHTSVAHA